MSVQNVWGLYYHDLLSSDVADLILGVENVREIRLTLISCVCLLFCVSQNLLFSHLYLTQQFQMPN